MREELARIPEDHHEEIERQIDAIKVDPAHLRPVALRLFGRCRFEADLFGFRRLRGTEFACKVAQRRVRNRRPGVCQIASDLGSRNALRESLLDVVAMLVEAASPSPYRDGRLGGRVAKLSGGLRVDPQASGDLRQRNALGGLYLDFHPQSPYD